jgi:hypothetical protein
VAIRLWAELRCSLASTGSWSLLREAGSGSSADRALQMQQTRVVSHSSEAYTCTKRVSLAMLQVQDNERTANSRAHSSVYMMGVSQCHMHAPKSTLGEQGECKQASAAFWCQPELMVSTRCDGVNWGVSHHARRLKLTSQRLHSSLLSETAQYVSIRSQ